MFSKKIEHRILWMAILFLLVQLSRLSQIWIFPHLGYIVGSQGAHFSMSNGILPLIGAFGGILGSFEMSAVLIGWRLLKGGLFPLHFLAYYIPGLFSSLYWALESKLLRTIPLVVCMALFILHPVGSQAALYALLWLIPLVAIYIQEGPFYQALGSTFTAHAIGSIIWLYTVPMTPDQWLALIPIALEERLLFAVNMSFVYVQIVEILALLAARKQQVAHS